ncbi:hypothetical protein HAX54_006776, partial [Datura stramonium]|nr:hypothetical protein [Datura stramonium]
MSHGSVDQWCVDSHEPSHSQVVRLKEPCLNPLSSCPLEGTVSKPTLTLRDLLCNTLLRNAPFLNLSCVNTQ